MPENTGQSTGTPQLPPGGDRGEPGGGSNPAMIGEDTPRTTEELDWRSRALRAEESLADSEARRVEAQASLDLASQKITLLERRLEVQRLLRAASPRDFDAAAAVLDDAMQRDGAALAPESLLDALTRDHPELFSLHGGNGPRVGSLSETVEEPGSLRGLAEQARSSGDRNLLFKYLRARRRS